MEQSSSVSSSVSSSASSPAPSSGVPSGAPNSPVKQKPTSKNDHYNDDNIGGTLRTIIWAAVIALLIRAFAFEPFNIPSGSMLPGLKVGDYLFVSKYTYGYSTLSTTMGYLNIPGRFLVRHEPRRGDVVVFKLPSKPQTDYIKRLVGLPGDIIQVKSGTVFVNHAPLPRERAGLSMMSDRDDKPLRPITEYRETTQSHDGGPERTYVVAEEYDNASLDNYGPVEVPPNHYFFMGDNRDNSQDSRTQLVSFVPRENLVGPAQLIFFSLDSDTQFYEFWRWPFALRWDRLLKRIS